MIDVEDGFQAMFDLAQVLAQAEAAAAVTSEAAIAIAIDGTRLRFTAGNPAVIVSLQDDQPSAGEVAYMELEPLAIRRAKSDPTPLEFLRHLVARGCTRLEMRRSRLVTGGWYMTANPSIEKRISPYDVPERYKVVSMTWPTHFEVLDLETGLAYREGPGRAPKQADREIMQEICDRLNAEASQG
ncbi:hypothetical protein AB0F88_17215 [Streptosporangium sp. NPDC023963]|uniref:hypothetical protein n=1 Tax=Streptosporangium sp. NPDC023963 TaxID=3155608 RepID=UPI003415AAF0